MNPQFESSVNECTHLCIKTEFTCMIIKLLLMNLHYFNFLLYLLMKYDIFTFFITFDFQIIGKYEILTKIYSAKMQIEFPICSMTSELNYLL